MASRSAPPRIPTPCCELRDGSVVELRERSGYSASQAGNDLTIHLDRGSIIVEAAKRRSGHLFVATADCRVAVTGTVFSVSAGVKGSRVSVIQGEVRVSEDNREKVLHPGEQAVTSASLEPLSVRDDISWSRNRDRLLKQLDALRTSIDKLHLPDLRYSSRLAGRLPASTAFVVSIPNLAQYLGEVQTVFQQNTWWTGSGLKVEPMIEKLRAASEYLGDEIMVTAFAGPDGKMLGPVVFAEVKREGFPEFLKRQGLPVAIETRPGVVAFGPPGGAVAAFAAALDSGFQNTRSLRAHRPAVRRRRRPAVVRRSRAAACAAAAAQWRPLHHRRAEGSQPPDGGSRHRGLRRSTHRNRRVAGRSLAHGRARLRLAGRHPGRRLRGEESGRHCG